MAEGGKSRGLNFAKRELNQLCYSWMHISQDPIVGFAQKNLTFWDRVTVHYNSNRPSIGQERPGRSLESKWGELKHDIAKFSGTYATVTDLRISGSNADDTLKKAHDLYVTKHRKNKSFQFEDCWVLLKDCPRFLMVVDNMANKEKGKGKGNANKENTPPNNVQQPEVVVLDTSNVDSGEADEGHSRPNLLQGNGRPIGNKAAKKLRGEECAMRIAATAQRDMVGLSSKRLKLMADQNLQNLFAFKAANIDKDCREYFVMSRRQELQKWKDQMADKIEEENRARRQTIARSPLPTSELPTSDESSQHIVRDPSASPEPDLAQEFAEQEIPTMKS